MSRKVKRVELKRKVFQQGIQLKRAHETIKAQARVISDMKKELDWLTVPSGIHECVYTTAEENKGTNK